MKVVAADQEFPYKLMKNRLFHTEQYKEMLCIINKNIPNISPTETIELLKKISSTGCSSAMFANALVEQIYNDDVSFKETFGFSLLTNDKIDCNKLMVDIFSKLYKICKIKFIEYKRYKYKNMKEASISLLSKEYDNENEIVLELLKNGILLDGLDDKDYLQFKDKNPKVTNYVGSVEEIAKEKFGTSSVVTIEELNNICKEKNIECEIKDTEIYEKLTGLGTSNFIFWSNYYLRQYNINASLISEEIYVRDFEENYNGFVAYIKDLLLEGYSISVSAGPNSQAYMHTTKKLSWSKISSSSAGHIMLLKAFDTKGDIVVSSYGEDYIIPKEYFSTLSFTKIKKTNNEELENNRNKTK